MAKEELLKSMQQQAEAELEGLQKEADERFARLRREYAARLRLAREDIRNRQRRELQRLLHAERYRSAQERQQKLLEHRWLLANRCRPLAAQLLESYWREERDGLLQRLLDSLPELNWSRIWVAPDDLKSAEEHPRHLPVCGDEQLTGGLIAECTERALIYDHSLPTWLERLWPVLLPALLEKIADECRHRDN